jgi:hypothetical protein
MSITAPTICAARRAAMNGATGLIASILLANQ